MEEHNQMSHKHHVVKFTLLLVVVIGFIAMGIISILRDRLVNPNMYQVQFSAEGSVFAKPDIAQIVVAVKTEKVKEAVQAVKDNTNKMNNVIDKLKDMDIETKDIKTTNYRLTPAYDYNRESGQRTLAGYDVYQELTIKIRDLDSVGEVIEVTTSAGVNQVGNVSFTIDDMSEIKKLAREEAVKKAEEKAEEMSKLTGLKLGKLVNVYENENAYPPLYKNYAVSMDETMGMGGGAPEIQVGENEVVLQVTLVYEVK